jgi:hypothetical protein
MPTGIFAEFGMFMQGSDSGVSVRNVNLSVAGVASQAIASQPLVAWNSQSGVAEDVTLYIRGSGITDGATPYQTPMNLFLQRPITDVVSLYMQGPGAPESSGVALCVAGATPVVSGMPLSLPQVVGVETGGNFLYTHGF